MLPKQQRGKKRAAPSDGSSSSSSGSSAACSTSSSSSAKAKVSRIIEGLAPSKSADIYKKTFNEFLTFAKIKTQKATEADVLLWIEQLASSGSKAKTLWTKFSMVKGSIARKWPGHAYNYAHVTFL